jgi:ammonia channel protein AmtB
MLTSTALVLLMIPGVGFFYSGLARRKSALSLIWLSMMSTAVVSFQVPALHPPLMPALPVGISDIHVI